MEEITYIDQRTLKKVPSCCATTYSIASPILLINIRVYSELNIYRVPSSDFLSPN